MKSYTYETLARLIALCGVLALGYVYFPIFNPKRSRLIFGEENASLGHYLIGTTASLPILGAAWYFTCKATRLKRVEQTATQPDIAAEKRR